MGADREAGNSARGREIERQMGFARPSPEKQPSKAKYDWRVVLPKLQAVYDSLIAAQ